MNKKELVTYIGGTYEQIAHKLDFASKQSIAQLPEVLTDKQSRNIIRRMMAARIKVPKEWTSPPP